MGNDDNDHGKIKTSQKHSNTHTFSIYLSGEFTFSILEFQKCNAAIYTCSCLIFVQFEQLSFTRRTKIVRVKNKKDMNDCWYKKKIQS